MPDHVRRPSRRLSWLRSSLLMGSALIGCWALAQKIDDIPPAVKNNVAPNFMFMIDNSGSMSNIVPASPYLATASYLGNCPSNSRIPAGSSVDIQVYGGQPRFSYNGTTYRHTTTSGTEPARCFDNSATYSARLLADGGSSGNRVPGNYLPSDYSGHYLNWYFGDYGGGPITGWTRSQALGNRCRADAH